MHRPCVLSWFMISAISRVFASASSTVRGVHLARELRCPPPSRAPSGPWRPDGAGRWCDGFVLVTSWKPYAASARRPEPWQLGHVAELPPSAFPTRPSPPHIRQLSISTAGSVARHVCSGRMGSHRRPVACRPRSEVTRRRRLVTAARPSPARARCRGPAPPAGRRRASAHRLADEHQDRVQHPRVNVLLRLARGAQRAHADLERVVPALDDVERASAPSSARRTPSSASSGQSGSRVPCTNRTGVRSATSTSSRSSPRAPRSGYPRHTSASTASSSATWQPTRQPIDLPGEHDRAAPPPARGGERLAVRRRRATGSRSGLRRPARMYG